jgi:hypothetical protein
VKRRGRGTTTPPSGRRSNSKIEQKIEHFGDKLYIIYNRLSTCKKREGERLTRFLSTRSFFVEISYLGFHFVFRFKIYNKYLGLNL